jgi:hypothetical protein
MGPCLLDISLNTGARFLDGSRPGLSIILCTADSQNSASELGVRDLLIGLMEPVLPLPVELNTLLALLLPEPADAGDKCADGGVCCIRFEDSRAETEVNKSLSHCLAIASHCGLCHRGQSIHPANSVSALSSKLFPGSEDRISRRRFAAHSLS